jgi:hypothetical protein
VQMKAALSFTNATIAGTSTLGQFDSRAKLILSYRWNTNN